MARPDGTLLIVSMLDRRVLALGRDGSLREHADLTPFASASCNDMVVAADGTAHVGHFGFDFEHGGKFATASLIKVSPTGEASIAAEDLLFPNGSVITPDDRTLIVGESFGGRYTAWDIESDGTLVNRRIWAELDGHTPDGCCLDAAGGIWMSDVTNSRFCRVVEGGQITDTIPVDANAVACMLGGDDGRTLHLLVSPGTRRDLVAGKGASRVLATRVEHGGAGRP